MYKAVLFEWFWSTYRNIVTQIFLTRLGGKCISGHWDLVHPGFRFGMKYKDNRWISVEQYPSNSNLYLVQGKARKYKNVRRQKVSSNFFKIL